MPSETRKSEQRTTLALLKHPKPTEKGFNSLKKVTQRGKKNKMGRFAQCGILPFLFFSNLPFPTHLNLQ